ncbi:hypothetical protein H920_15186 [Fukomys damarensis]|uniref:Uncharacterized protein n=1 Tax=Fukomys damarensis TaxID=885580 RepID=A0A091DKT1_FUKDA|nr:hypothetical protein H920_15186 [Fukomys damarensis]
MTVKNKCFELIKDIKAIMTIQLTTLTKEDFQSCFRKWQKRWDECIQSNGGVFGEELMIVDVYVVAKYEIPYKYIWMPFNFCVTRTNEQGITEDILACLQFYENKSGLMVSVTVFWDDDDDDDSGLSFRSCPMAVASGPSGQEHTELHQWCDPSPVWSFLAGTCERKAESGVPRGYVVRALGEWSLKSHEDNRREFQLGRANLPLACGRSVL